jgi:hypothetical protein
VADICRRVVGAALTLAPVLLPKYQEYLPSASAFGLAWVFNWYYGLLFFLGDLIALLIERRNPKLAKEFTLPVASGVVAGGSLMPARAPGAPGLPSFLGFGALRPKASRLMICTVTCSILRPEPD